MTENNIKLLGFEKRTGEFPHPYYYYMLNLVDGLSFITNASDEVDGEVGGWFIEFFDTAPSIRYFDYGEAVGIIENIKRHTVK